MSDGLGIGIGRVSDGMGSGIDVVGSGNEMCDVDGAGCAVEVGAGAGRALLVACVFGAACCAEDDRADVGEGVGWRVGGAPLPYAAAGPPLPCTGMAAVGSGAPTGG